MIVPENGSGTISFSFLRVWLIVAALLSVLALFVLLFVGITYGQLVQTAVAHNNLLSRYQLLLDEREKIKEISRDLQKLRFYKDQVKNTLTGYVDVRRVSNDSLRIDSPVGEYTLLALEETAQLGLTSQNYPILSPVAGFVTRKMNLSGGESHHPGVDLAAATGTPIKAAGGGVVIFTGWTRDFGNTVIILHERGYHTHYGHCRAIAVKIGEKVSAGQIIATVGDSGLRSSGAHLHFELWRYDIPLDPMQFINKTKDES
jgi:murein DD-endopeptidase MepM/ murein hydrolase activator NlpD